MFPDPSGRPSGEAQSGDDDRWADIKSFTVWFYQKIKKKVEFYIEFIPNFTLYMEVMMDVLLQFL